MKRTLHFVVIFFVVINVFAGCSSKKTLEEVANQNKETLAVNELGNTVADSSDLPDWTGKKISLKLWYAQGTGSVKRTVKSENDVVTPELYRVTGVKYGEESFDNGGELMDAKIAKIMAANDWPDVVLQPERAVLEKMIEADMVYDLTDLIPQYCTNIYALANRESGENFLKSERKDGRRYTLPVTVPLSFSAPDLDPKIVAKEQVPLSPLGFVYIRDDILKKLYPNAKTQDEIESLYLKNGSFTKEEILDVSINSKEEFFQMLYNIKKLGMKEGNREVYPFYVADGLDNWGLLTTLGNIYGYNINKGGDNNYFTYWDKELKQVQYMFKQDFFKEVLKDWTKLVQDNIASPDSLVDNRAAFEEKVNSGQYAVLYGATVPDQNVLNGAGKPYKYRKLYINIPLKTDKFLFSNVSKATETIAILKKNVKAEDLPQILRFYDFVHSEAGQKLAIWGPRSAGLWTEQDGKRMYVDKELEAKMVHDEANNKQVYYNLNNAAWPGYPIMGGSRYLPKIIYDIERKPSMANRYFNMAIVEEAKTTTANSPYIWMFDGYGVPGVQKFWQARQSFESALTKIFIAKNEEEFEQLYQEMITLSERNGLTEDTLAEINQAYREYINADYMSNLE